MEAGIIEDSSPIFADLNGDGRQEILFGSVDGTLYVRNQKDGSPYWPNKMLPAPINSSPAVADLNGDGKLDVIVSFNGKADTSLNYDGGVRAFDNSGRELWTFWMDVDVNPYGHSMGVYASPSIGDVDQDGKPEIAIGGWDRNMHLIKGENGQEEDGLWPVHLADTCWSTAALADLDGNDNGKLEIIVGADITGGGFLPDGTPTQDGGFMWVFEHDGTKKWRYYVNETIYSSPAVADINNDGHLEIVSGTGWFWYARGRATTKAVYAWDRNGTLLPGFPALTDDMPGFSSPALADFDGDDDLEIVIGAGLPTGAGQGAGVYGRLYAFHHDGSPVAGWPAMPQNCQGASAFIRASPAIADYDNDGQFEVFCSMGWDILVFDESGQQILGTNPNDNLFGTRYSAFSTPAIGDPDGDGKLEVAVASSDVDDPYRGHLYLWDVESSASAELPWPMFHHDAQHTGCISPASLNVGVASLPVIHPDGSTGHDTAFLAIRNSGDTPIDWTASVFPILTQPPFSVDPRSGILNSLSSTMLTIRVNNVSLYNGQAGCYDVGYIQINATVDGKDVPGSPAKIPVNLCVGNVVWFPPIMK